MDAQLRDEYVTELQAQLTAATIDLAAARRINANQRIEIERLQERCKKLAVGRGGWGDRL